VIGRGTEAETLEQARIDRAVGLVAGTDDDANNLSILMTARQMNPKLFLVARQNHLDNQELFEAVGAQIVMHPSTIIAERIRVLLATPLLSEFENYARYRDHEWACELISRIAALVEDRVPEVWEVAIDSDQAQAVCTATEQGSPLMLAELLRDPRDRETTLPAIALMLVHKSERTLLPEARITLRRGDRVLFCGFGLARSRMEWTLQNNHALAYVQTGEGYHPGTLWTWGSRILGGRSRRRR
jgi:voltage-gated potassium channel